MTERRSSRRVVITGMGIITAIGDSVRSFSRAIFNGRCGIGPVSLFATEGYPSRFAGQVPDENLGAGLNFKRMRRASRCDLLGLVAAREAVADAGLDAPSFSSSDIGVVLGGGAGGMLSWETYRKGTWAGGTRSRPSKLLSCHTCALTDLVAKHYGLTGTRATISTACSSGATSIGYGFDLIRSGVHDVVVTGGSEALCELTFAGFSAMRVMDPAFCRPFHRHRQGLSLGEGAAVIVLEEHQHATARGAPVHAEVLGYAVNCDAYHMTSPDPRGAGMSLVMSTALRNAGVEPDRVGYINAHGTGTKANDLMESRAIRRVFGRSGSAGLSVSSTKSMTGHCLGAAGAVEAVATVLALNEQRVPPTAHLDESDPELDLDFVPMCAKRRPMDVAISNSFAFGGNNTCLVFGNPGRVASAPSADRAAFKGGRQPLSSDEIVFTGLGVVSPLGEGVSRFWSNCLRTRTGICRITLFDANDRSSNVAGWVKGFDPKRTLAPKVYRRMSRISRMAVVASRQAMEDSGLPDETLGGDRIGVVMGTSFGSSSRVDEFFLSLLEDGPRGAQPFLFPETVPNAPASHIAMVHGLTGPNCTFCQNGLSSENAVLYGRNLLLSDQADAVVVGGADELSAAQYACYEAIGALARIRVDHDGPVYPVPGAGIVLGEGAGVLVMERRETAMKRGARIYGVLQSAWMAGGDPELGHYEIEGTQMARAMSSALAHAGIEPEQVDRLDVSANFSGELDRMEHDQIQRIFGNRRKPLEATPLKYLMGDFGGAGAVRMAGILLSLHQGTGIPSVEIEVLNGNDGLPVGSETWKTPREKGLRTVLMTSSTHGGGSCSMVFSRDRSKTQPAWKTRGGSSPDLRTSRILDTGPVSGRHAPPNSLFRSGKGSTG